jgi:septal ring-binding cell division protein DamX
MDVFELPAARETKSEREQSTKKQGAALLLEDDIFKDLLPSSNHQEKPKKLAEENLSSTAIEARLFNGGKSASKEQLMSAASQLTLNPVDLDNILANPSVISLARSKLCRKYQGDKEKLADVQKAAGLLEFESKRRSGTLNVRTPGRARSMPYCTTPPKTPPATASPGRPMPKMDPRNGRQSPEMFLYNFFKVCNGFSFFVMVFLIRFPYPSLKFRRT